MSAGDGKITTYFVGENGQFLNTIAENNNGLGRQLAALFPLEAAIMRNNKAVDNLEQAHKRGRLTVDQLTEALARQKVKFDEQSASLTKLGGASGAARSGMQQLSYQLNDIAQGFASGTSATTIFVQQSGQVFQSLQLMGTGGKGLLGFLGGPWGLGITTAASVLVPFIANLLKGGASTDQLVEALKRKAAEDELAKQAADIYSKSIEGQEVATRKLNEEMKKSLETEQKVIEQAYMEAQAHLSVELATRKRLATALELRKAELDAAKARADAPGANNDARALGVWAQSEQYEALKQHIAQNDVAISEAEQRVGNTMAKVAEARAALASDPVKKLNADFDKMKKDAEAASAATAANLQNLNDKEAIGAALLKERLRLTAELTNIEKNRAAGLKTLQQSESASNRQFGVDINVDDAMRIVQGIGGRVTSGTRSNAKQRQLYADMLAGRHNGPVAIPGTSAHERGQAIDVAYGPGISVATIRLAFSNAGVSLRQIKDEPGQGVYHVEWGAKSKSSEQLANEAEAKRVAELNRQQAYVNEPLKSAQGRLLTFERKTADTAEERYNAAMASALADYTANAEKYRLELESGKLKKKEYDTLMKTEAEVKKAAEAAAAEAAARKFLGDAAQHVEALRRSEFENAKTALEGELETARTQAERRKIQIELLGLERDEKIRALDKAFAEKKIVQAEYDSQLAGINAGFQRGTAATMRSTRGPMTQWIEEARLSTGQIKEQIEGIEVRWVDDLNSGLAGAVSKALGLHGAMARVVDDVITILLKMGEAGAANGGGVSGFLHGIGSFFSAFGSSKGGVGLSSGQSGLLAGLPKLAGGGMMLAGGSGQLDSELLSIGGKARAWISPTERLAVIPAGGRSGGAQAPTVVQLVVGEGQMFEPRVTGISGNVSVRTVSKSRRYQAIRDRQRLA